MSRSLVVLTPLWIAGACLLNDANAQEAPIHVASLVEKILEPVGDQAVDLHVDIPPDHASWPRLVVRTGVPFARGALRSAQNVRVENADGRETPFQVKTLSTWDEGQSIRYLLVTFTAETKENRPYRLRFGRNITMTSAAPMTMSDAGGIVTIGAGTTAVRIHRTGETLFDMTESHTVVRGRVVDQHGNLFTISSAERQVDVEEIGPVAAVVRIAGWYADAKGEKLNQFVCRVYLYREMDIVRLVHTFINTAEGEDRQYRQIALQLDAGESPRSVEFAGDTLATPLAAGEGFAAVQVDSRHARVLRLKSGSEPQALRETDRLGNAVRLVGETRSVSAAVRWLWQQHPSGFEIQPDGTLLVQLWSPHQPRSFDLRPKEYLENLAPGAYDLYRTQSKNSQFKYQIFPEDGGTLDPSGQGLGKAHEIVLHVGSSSAAPPLTALAALAEHPPFAYPGPEYACNTGVRHRLAPRDAQCWPAAEKLLGDLVDGLYAMREWSRGYGDGYGYFSFGDTPHGNASGFHRFWSHQFYCGPASYWQLYFRSGDRRIREWADANARHVMELDTGHVTNDITQAGAMLYEDCGVFHYYSCNPGKGYTAVMPNTSNIAEYLAMMYQMTGDERAGEVMLEVQGAFKAQWARSKPTWSHRATGYSLRNALSIYEVTHDATMRQIIDLLAQQVLDNVRDGVTTGYDGNTPADFTLAYIFPAAIDYIRLTGDERMARWLVRNAHFCASTGNIGKPDYFNVWDGLVAASQLTGEPRYARIARQAVENWTTSYDPTGWAGKVWGLYKTPIVLAATADLDPSAIAAAPSVADSSTEIVFAKLAGQPLNLSAQVMGPTLAVAFSKTAKFDPLPAIELIDPAGQVHSRRPYPTEKYDAWYTRGAWVEWFTLDAAAPAGVYRLRLLNMPAQSVPPEEPLIEDKAMIPAVMRVRIEPATPIMGRVGDDGVPPGGVRGSGRMFFRVPADATRIAIAIESPQINQALTVTLLDPQGNPAGTMNLPAQPKNLEWFTVSAEPKPEQRGQIWSIDLPRMAQLYRMRVEGFEPCFATREAWVTAPAASRP